MGMFERFMEKAPQLDEAEEYYDSEEYEYDDYEEEAPVSKIRAVAPAEEVSRIATCWPTNFADVATFADEFRKDLPVILNLANADDSARQRIADFALGAVVFPWKPHLPTCLLFLLRLERYVGCCV